MTDMVEGGVEASNENIATEHMDTGLIATDAGEIASNIDAKGTADLPTAEVPAEATPAPEDVDTFPAANSSGETALDNATYDNGNGNEDKDGEDQPSPVAGNEVDDCHPAGEAGIDNDIDLIAVAALAIPQAGAPPQYDFDPSTLPVLSPLITRKDISRRDLPLMCHVVGCNLGLGPQAEYYQRYRICKDHLRSAALLVDSVPQRFCQQCGKFHDLDAFDGDKRNCRARLAQHNSRRRKAGAGTPSAVIPYGQGTSGRKRIPTSFEGFNTEFDFDYPGSAEPRKKRARIPVSKEFPPQPKPQRVSKPPKHRRNDEEDEEDNGFLDQLLAAATGLEEEEQRSGEEQQHHSQRPRQKAQGARYYNQDDDEPYTYDPNATAMHHPAAAPPRLTSRPVASAHHAQYNGNGGSAMPAAGNPHQQNGGGYTQFGGWPGPAQAADGADGYLPVVHSNQIPYGLPPTGGPVSMAAAVSELERVMGRQLLQSLIAGAGLPAAMVAPPPPPPPQQPGAQQLLDMLRSMAGASGTGAGANAAAYFLPSDLQQPSVYHPQAVYAPPTAASGGGIAALASLLGAEAPQPDRAQNALDALRKLVSTLPTNDGAAPATTGAEAPVVAVKAEPVAEAEVPPSALPRSENLIEQLADALRVQNEATNAVIGHHTAAALLDSGEPAAANTAAAGGGKPEPSPPRSVASVVTLAQQDVMRRLMSMLDHSKSGIMPVEGTKAPSKPPADASEGEAAGPSPELLLSLIQQAEAAMQKGVQPVPVPET